MKFRQTQSLLSCFMHWYLYMSIGAQHCRFVLFLWTSRKSVKCFISYNGGLTDNTATSKSYFFLLRMESKVTDGYKNLNNKEIKLIK